MDGDRREGQDSPADASTRALSDAATTTPGSVTPGSVPEPPASNVPERWGEFRIIRELGRGGFGHVYRAFDEGLSKEIALKVVRLRDRFRLADVMREGQMLARMRHHHIVTVHAVRQVGDEVGFVMELVEGESLEQRVKRAGQLGPEEAIAIGQTLCHALAAVHGAGLLHRDIKARNVMREAGGRIVLMDFGAGRDRNVHEPSDDLTGTPLYLAPELFHGESASPASDLYSLGVLLYFLVTGAYPVEGPTAVAIAMAHVAGSRKLLVDRRPDLPRDFIRVVERALSVSPSARYQSAGEMLTELDALSVRGDHHPPLPPVPAPLVTPRPTVSRAGVWAAGVLGAGAFVVFLGFLSTRAYDAAFDLERFADDSLSVWAVTGARGLISPTILAGITIIIWFVVRAAWLSFAPVVPPAHRLGTRLHSSVSGALRRRMPADINVLGRWLLLTQVSAVVVLFLLFRDFLTALISTFEVVDPSVWQLLYYTEDFVRPLNYYQQLLPIVAVGMAIGWWRLLRKAGAIEAVDRSLVGAGIAIIVVVIAAIVVPDRVFYKVQYSEGYLVGNERCYVVARLASEARLFCPDAPAGSRGRDVATASLRSDQKIADQTIYQPPK